MTLVGLRICLKYFIYSLLFLQSKSEYVELGNDLLRFCDNLGLKYLTVYSNETSAEVNIFLKSLLYKSKSEFHDLRTNQLKIPGKIGNGLTLKYEQDILVVVASSYQERWENYLTLISKTKIKRAVFVVVGGIKDFQLENIVKLEKNK